MWGNLISRTLYFAYPFCEIISVCSFNDDGCEVHSEGRLITVMSWVFGNDDKRIQTSVYWARFEIAFACSEIVRLLRPLESGMINTAVFSYFSVPSFHCDCFRDTWVRTGTSPGKRLAFFLQSLKDLGRLTYRRFLELFRQMVGLLGWVISPSQGHNTGNADKHPWLKRDSNPRSQQPTGQDPRFRPHGHCDRQKTGC
jgi:hypothetical protein